MTGGWGVLSLPIIVILSSDLFKDFGIWPAVINLLTLIGRIIGLKECVIKLPS